MTQVVATDAARTHYAARLAAVQAQIEQARLESRHREAQALRIAEKVLLSIIIELDAGGVPEQPQPG